jgi:hypothetical protein
MTHMGIPDDGRSAPTHRAGMAEAFDMLAAVVEEMGSEPPAAVSEA